ncbi:hypothetical protein KAI32_04480 [Candidatus Pacearchaeota archaeon]|nr:hypothetical protein [Candidatus Pacearchaeota archaeon]
MRREELVHKNRYLEWKERCGKRIPDISEANSRIISGISSTEGEEI